MSPLLEDFCRSYQQFDQQLIAKLPELYNQDVRFCDPVHCIDGLGNLTRYFERQLDNVGSCQFDIRQVVEQGNQATVIWDMHLQHPRLNRGRMNSTSGCTYLEFQDNIHYHRDYFDLGCMLYEQLPLLGGIVRRIRKSLR